MADRRLTIAFYRAELGMHVLRHEEFAEGCEATCNGPYAGRWSKTMMGYGNENTHFVVELVYNYGLHEYSRGNQLQEMLIIRPTSSVAVSSTLEPNGCPYRQTTSDAPPTDPLASVAIATADLERAVVFWTNVCGMHVVDTNDEQATLRVPNHAFTLVLRKVETVERGTADGRIAFSCPAKDLPTFETTACAHGGTILTPLVSLPTPGKADVQVVILADPDGHEVCLVGDEAYITLSERDETADRLVDEAIARDSSAEWAKRFGMAPTNS